MEAERFEELQAEFMERVQQAVYCSVATIDRRGRPRSRVMHVVWDGPTGWVITNPASHKAAHLARSPHVSLAYIANPLRPVYIDCLAEWVSERAMKLKAWELHKNLAPPLGFDPAPHYGSVDNPLFGLLRFRPWRLELAALGAESLVWRPGGG